MTKTQGSQIHSDHGARTTVCEVNEPPIHRRVDCARAQNCPQT